MYYDSRDVNMWGRHTSQNQWNILLFLYYERVDKMTYKVLSNPKMPCVILELKMCKRIFKFHQTINTIRTKMVKMRDWNPTPLIICKATYIYVLTSMFLFSFIYLNTVIIAVSISLFTNSNISVIFVSTDWFFSWLWTTIPSKYDNFWLDVRHYDFTVLNI